MSVGCFIIRRLQFLFRGLLNAKQYSDLVDITVRGEEYKRDNRRLLWLVAHANLSELAKVFNIELHARPYKFLFLNISDITLQENALITVVKVFIFQMTTDSGFEASTGLG